MQQQMDPHDLPGLTDEELAEEVIADLPVREAMTVLDLGGLGGRVLPSFAPAEDSASPILPAESHPS